MMQMFPWLIPTYQQLIDYKKNNKIPHGIILSGPSGIGKQKLANDYAKFLLCENLTTDVCDQCRSCQLFAVGNHPDFLKVECEEDSRVIKIDQVRNLVHFVGQTSSCSRYQVAIIHTAELMNKAANNALLKTLEEPRGDVVIVLVTDLLSGISPTVRSRCHILKIAPPNLLQGRQWLMAQPQGPQNVETFLAIADNLPLKALELANTDHLTYRDLLLDQLLKLGQKKQDPVIAAEQILTIDLRTLLTFWISIIMDMIRIQCHAGLNDLNHRDQFPILAELGQKKSLSQLFSYLDKLYEGMKSLNHQINLNTLLLIEKLCIHWYCGDEIS